MLKTITTALLTLFCFVHSFANDYDDAWKAIGIKDFKTAKELLLKATQKPATAMDAYLTFLYMQTYQGKETQIEGLNNSLLSDPNKNAYLYPLWFNGGVLGKYSKKQAYQFNLLNAILNDKSINGSMQSAAHYVKGMHYIFNHDFTKAKQEWAAMNAVNDWQLAGPFENISGSGFNNANGPITNADNKAVFKGTNNVDLTWFTPFATNREGWLFTNAHIPQRSAIIYAQSFVYVPEETKALLNVGGNGSLKVWINDGLVLSEAKERMTELDYYKNYCILKKGYNRVLVQLGYTRNNQSNFIVRFTDADLNPIKGLQATDQPQAYTKSDDAISTASLKHFAEDFFEKKVAEQPTNLLNYVLLSQTYLRDERTTEARQVIEKALSFSPENPLLKYELIQCLMRAGNRTLLMQQIEWLKENDQESYINFQLKIDNLIEEEKYDDADEQLSKMKALYDEDEYMFQKKIIILAKQEKVEELIKKIEVAYNRFPDNIGFLSMMYRVKKQTGKDPKAALTVYENYLKNNYNYDIQTALADEYKAQGMNDKYLAVLKQLNANFNYDPTYAIWLTKYYYEQQNYQEALTYAQQALKLAPFTGTYWKNMASIQEQMNKKDEAIASYKKTIYYDRTDYDARKKLSALQQKPDLYKLIPDDDAYVAIKKATAESKYDFSYLLDQKSTIIYDEGASEEYIHYAVKIHTQKGIDSWKELYLNYDDDNQTLLVEKCEVVKANGSKVPAERNDNHVVFTGLEPGDAIHVKYRIQNYATGRLSREFWDKFSFNAFVPSIAARYTLIAPLDYQFSSIVNNVKIEPTVKNEGGYKIYTWEASNMPALKSEPYMPPLNDAGNVLHLSTVKSWKDIANWYSDISYQNLSNNFELNGAYNEIFSKVKPASNLEKARLIYEYILNNIRYSSVSFRQSGFVPQDVSKIISTRLGDCKDLSTLFVALADKAGIPAQLVLIDTRNNGSKDMLLPSMDFNHCIALAKIDGKNYYLELTDNNLPFGSLPNNLNGALSLVIPPHGQKATEDLKPLQAVNRKQDKIVRSINVRVSGRDEKFTIDVKRFGSLTSSWRDDYATLSEEEQQKNFEQMISNGYKNPVKLESLSFTNLKNLSDSLGITYNYTVKNEVVEAGSMKMIKIPLIDVVATVDNFSADKREFPIEYWNYENTDSYETTATVQLAADQKFLEIPANQTFVFKNSSYTVKYSKEGDKLKIVRIAKLQRENILPSEYSQFKTFFNNIVEAESKYIVFK